MICNVWSRRGVLYLNCFYVWFCWNKTTRVLSWVRSGILMTLFVQFILWFDVSRFHCHVIDELLRMYALTIGEVWQCFTRFLSHLDLNGLKKVPSLSFRMCHKNLAMLFVPSLFEIVNSTFLCFMNKATRNLAIDIWYTSRGMTFIIFYE